MNNDYTAIQNALEQLFLRWQKAHREENITNEALKRKQNTFVKDGLVSEEYDHLVLFLLKESNIDSYSDVNKISDQKLWYQKCIRECKDNHPRQIGKMGRIYLTLAGESIDTSERKIFDAVRRVAFMNINKRGGGSVCNPAVLDDYAATYKQYIIDEINILNPKYIVCFGTAHVLEKIAPEFKDRIIRMWHTAYVRNRKGHISIDKYMTEFNKRLASYRNVIIEYKQ